MKQDYIIKDLKVSDFKDQNGNTCVNLSLEGIGEPVTAFKKDPTKLQVGDKLYGEVKLHTAQSGKEYLRLFPAQREDQQKSQYSNHSNDAAPKKEYQPRDDCAIQAQWAIGQAVKACTEQGIFEEDAIEDLAKKFFAMIDRIKVGNKTDNEPSDDDMDEAIRNGKPIELSEIPFGN